MARDWPTAQGLETDREIWKQYWAESNEHLDTPDHTALDETIKSVPYNSHTLLTLHPLGPVVTVTAGLCML